MKHIRILLVEDNPDDRLLIKRGISKGLETSTVIDVLNPQELEEEIAKGVFDIAVTDYNLGWTDGIQVLQAIKNKWPECPVVMMTVMDTEEVAVKAMNAGLDNYIVKSSSQFALMGEIIRSALEQKEQAQALQDAEIRYQELFETVPIGLFRENKEGKQISVNQTLVSMLGYPSKEALLTTKSEDIYLNHDERTQNIAQLTSENDLKTWEAQLRKYSRDTISVSITAQVIFDISGEVLFYEGYVRDISERKRVEEALSQSEILNETIIASVNDGVVVIDQDLRIVSWNSFMEHISGLTQTDVKGLPLMEVYPPDLEKNIQASLLSTLTGMTVHLPDTLHYFKISDSEVWLETTFSPLRTRQNDLIGVVANIHDITQRKENETEREILLAAEQKRSRELAALTTAATTISSNLEIQQVLDVVAEQMINLLNIDNCIIYSWNEAQKTILKEIEHHAIYGVPTEISHPKKISEQHPEISQVLSEATPFQVVISLQELSTSFKEEMADKQIQAVLLIPLTHQQRTIGLIKLEDHQAQRRFDRQEIFLAEMLGNQAAVALENARLFNETNKSLQREQQLHTATREISSLLDLDAIIQTTNQLVTEITGGEFSGTLLIDPDTGTALDVIYHQAPPGAPTDLPGTGGGLSEKMVESRELWVLDDYSDHPNALPFWIDHGVKATMFIPLETSDSLLGFIAIFSTDANKKFTPREQEQGISIARQAGVAMHKAILYDQTMRRSEELRSLYDIALATGSVLDSNTLLQRLQSNIEQFLTPDSYGIFLYHEETESFEIATATTENNPVYEMQGDHYPLKPGGLISEVMLQRKPIRIDDLEEGDRKNVLLSFNPRLKSWLGIPLISGDRLVGALSVQSFKDHAFSDDDQRFLESIAGQVSIALDNAHLYEELEDAFVQTVVALANAVDVRDAYTHDHSQRIAVYTNETGKALGLDDKQLENLRWGALLHDIGKIGVPDDILLKPGKLTDEEYEIIKRHPGLGAAIVAPVKKLQPVAPIIRAHQERFDGTGYPDKLSGDQIPIAARVLSVVDSYVAMTDDRVYRKAISHEEAVQEIKDCAGTQHDPAVVDAFLEVIQNFRDSNISPTDIDFQDINIASPNE
jgi:PAS domain S-box-containing protein/putative nucleotidyltransferase with HDIG domain